MVAFRTQGADDLDQLAAALKEAADKDLQKRVSASLRMIAKPLGVDVLRTGAEEMPQRGGLAARVTALGRVGVSNSLRGRVASVSVLLKNKGVALGRLDGGVLSHPVFGNRNVWVRQDVPAGAFSRAFQARAVVAQAAALKAANETLEEVARSV